MTRVMRGRLENEVQFIIVKIRPLRPTNITRYMLTLPLIIVINVRVVKQVGLVGKVALRFNR